MVHARMSALGWVVGGSGTVVAALLEALGPRGTLVAYASWQEHVYHAGEWPAEHRAAYLAEPPGVRPRDRRGGARPRPDPRARAHLAGARAQRAPRGERRRRRPARAPSSPRTTRSTTPTAPTSPFARLVAAGGDVLMLGAPLETLTLLHHAEAIASAPGKRTVTFEIPVATPGGVETPHLHGHRHEPRRLPLRATSTCPSRTSSRRSPPPRSRPASAPPARSAQATCHLFPARRADPLRRRLDRRSASADERGELLVGGVGEERVERLALLACRAQRALPGQRAGDPGDAAGELEVGGELVRRGAGRRRPRGRRRGRGRAAGRRAPARARASPRTSGRARRRPSRRSGTGPCRGRCAWCRSLWSRLTGTGERGEPLAPARHVVRERLDGRQRPGRARRGRGRRPGRRH